MIDNYVQVFRSTEMNIIHISYVVAESLSKLSSKVKRKKINRINRKTILFFFLFFSFLHFFFFVLVGRYHGPSLMISSRF